MVEVIRICDLRIQMKRYVVISAAIIRRHVVPVWRRRTHRRRRLHRWGHTVPLLIHRRPLGHHVLARGHYGGTNAFEWVVRADPLRRTEQKDDQ
jgi:hypothetical protein